VVFSSLRFAYTEYLFRTWYGWFVVALLCVSPFFFIGGSSYDDPRSIKEVWNLGHFFYFGMLVLVLDGYWCSRSRSLFFRVFAGLGTVFFLGLGIELIQLDIADRFFSWSDVVRDLSGGTTALLWKVGRRRSRRQSLVCGFVVMVLVFYSFFPFGAALADEYRSYRDLPLLAGFESKGELSRWEGGRVRLRMVASPRVQGSYSGKINLTTDEYSGLSMIHFPGDWSGWNSLAFDVFNPGLEITLHYRVHDYLHRGDKQTYGNRFNGSTVLEHGWNEIVIPMTDIINGPKDREMDVKKMRGFGIFVMKQVERRVLYLDDVRLL
jgi:hypothetical protein